jgi:hypothetical protein
MLGIEVILRMEMIHALYQKCGDPFQSDMFCGGLLSMLCITSNPLGIQTCSFQRSSNSFFAESARILLMEGFLKMA